MTLEIKQEQLSFANERKFYNLQSKSFCFPSVCSFSLTNLYLYSLNKNFTWQQTGCFEKQRGKKKETTLNIKPPPQILFRACSNNFDYPLWRKMQKHCINTSVHGTVLVSQASLESNCFCRVYLLKVPLWTDLNFSWWKQT